MFLKINIFKNIFLLKKNLLHFPFLLKRNCSELAGDGIFNNVSCYDSIEGYPDKRYIQVSDEIYMYVCTVFRNIHINFTVWILSCSAWIPLLYALNVTLLELPFRPSLSKDFICFTLDVKCLQQMNVSIWYMQILKNNPRHPVPYTFYDSML